MQSWNILERTTVLQQPRFLTVEYHTIELPDGQRIDDWAWIITPDYVNVALITEAGQFVCFRQEKYAIEGLSLAPVGGYLEPGEDPLLAAQRETREETGYEASEWIPLGTYAVDGNRGAGTAHFYLARGARQVMHPHADDLEEQELVLLSQAEVVEALAAGEFRVLGWGAVIALALVHLAS